MRCQIVKAGDAFHHQLIAIIFKTVIFRYTPYDCACVAEQLEVAQVLAEAGGISVTKIMEVAATRIQAAVRGHLTRNKLGKCHRLQGTQEGKKKHFRETPQTSLMRGSGK